eukprot:3910217-Rhodomonas_salina.1
MSALLCLRRLGYAGWVTPVGLRRLDYAGWVTPVGGGRVRRGRLLPRLLPQQLHRGLASASESESSHVPAYPSHVHAWLSLSRVCHVMS